MSGVFWKSERLGGDHSSLCSDARRFAQGFNAVRADQHFFAVDTLGLKVQLLAANGFNVGMAH